MVTLSLNGAQEELAIAEAEGEAEQELVPRLGLVIAA